MNKRPIDKTKKSNIKCEHCKNYAYEDMHGKSIQAECSITHELKNYWNRCKQFEWSERCNESEEV